VAPDDPVDLQAAGERIEALLGWFAAGAEPARVRAEELVALVTELHGAGLRRLLELVDEAGALDEPLLRSLCDDPLLSGLLLLHGLHPRDTAARVEEALAEVRPYLASHGGDVELVGIDDEVVVHLQLLGSCHGCPSSGVTLALAVQTAVEAAAPEVAGIDCRQADVAAPTVIGVDQLLQRTRAWVPVDGEPLAEGEVRAVELSGRAVVLCRAEGTSYAFLDGCARCGGGLAGGALHQVRRLACPGCGAAYDVRRAGASVDGGNAHLVPLPLLERGRGTEVAVDGVTPAVPA
jgi:Fe-S cluster biogenesis protein NfuA/nitrite reductase/ring-hydroxylating ferredoxin subunit